MKLVQKLLNKLNGLHYRQEYLCLAPKSFSQPLQVYLVNGRRIKKNVTTQHQFVGYSPLVFAFSDAALPQNIQLVFLPRLLQPNEIFMQKDAIAVLNLKRIHQGTAANSTVFFYQGTNGAHRFQSAFHQLINSLYNRLYNKKPGNVFLYSNLYKQVQIAYAVPRAIALITVSDGSKYNLFPTDLHGQVNSELYIISLRTGGKACEQVEAAGKLLISEVDCNAYKMVYALGKNHMQPLKPKTHFTFSALLSSTFGWPVPDYALSYKELILQDAFTHGIHKILLFKIINSIAIMPATGTLAHIHNSYASWRYKKGMEGNYLLR